MTYGPKPPEQYEGTLTDSELERDGWAFGLDVWEQVTKAYENYLGDPTLANSQLWSLRQAIRLEVLEEIGEAD